MKFCFKLQKSAKETHEMLKLVYGDAELTMKMVYKRIERICNGFELNHKRCSDPQKFP